MIWVVYAIVAYFLWSITNLIDKILIDKYIKNHFSLTFLGSFFGSLFILIYIIFFHKFIFVSWIVFVFALLAGFTRVLSYILYFKSASFEEMSRITTLWQFSPVFAFILSYLFLGEKLSLSGFIAFIFLIAAGFFASTRLDEKSIRISPAFWLMVLSTLGMAIGTVLDKYIFNINFWPALGWTMIGEFISIGILALIMKDNIYKKFLICPTDGKLLLLGDEVISGAALIIFSFALSKGSVSLISALSATNPIFVFIFALISTIWFPKFLKEDMTKNNLIPKIIGIILMTVGLWILNK